MTWCKQCEPGYYCPYGSADRIACPAGSWSLGASEFCTLCLAGFECPFTTKPATNPCLLGTYTDLPGEPTCFVCPKNYECIGNTKIPCWDGIGIPYKWSFEGEGRCKFFEAGKIPSPDGGPYVLLTYSPIDCASGKFAAYATRLCIDCPIGHKCPTPNVPPIKCLPGEY